MAADITIVAGIPIPSSSPAFLGLVGLHVAVALACTIAGAVAMLSRKGRGRHSDFGTVYYWCLSAAVATASILAVIRWAEDRHLFILGLLAFAAASWGRTVLRRRQRNWVRLHVVAMGASYILLLTAFYVDNGRNLPLWRQLPELAFWLLPSIVGLPIIIYVLSRHPLIKPAIRSP